MLHLFRSQSNEISQQRLKLQGKKSNDGQWHQFSSCKLQGYTTAKLLLAKIYIAEPMRQIAIANTSPMGNGTSQNPMMAIIEAPCEKDTSQDITANKTLHLCSLNTHVNLKPMQENDRTRNIYTRDISVNFVIRSLIS